MLVSLECLSRGPGVLASGLFLSPSGSNDSDGTTSRSAQFAKVANWLPGCIEPKASWLLASVLSVPDRSNKPNAALGSIGSFEPDGKRQEQVRFLLFSPSVFGFDFNCLPRMLKSRAQRLCFWSLFYQCQTEGSKSKPPWARCGQEANLPPLQIVRFGW